MKGKRISIRFDGVYMNSTVYINGIYLGNRPYGFSSFEYDLTPYLKYGKEENLVPPLFAFNVGLEAGQLLIVAVVLLLSVFATAFIHIRETDKNFFVSSAVFGIACMLMLERFPFLKD